MKKYDNIFLSLGVLFMLIPIYNFFGWVYVWNAYPNNMLFTERLDIYYAKVLFNLFEGRYSSGLSIVTFGIVSGVFFLFCVINSLHFGKKLKRIKIFLLIFNALFTGWTLWTLL